MYGSQRGIEVLEQAKRRGLHIELEASSVSIAGLFGWVRSLPGFAGLSEEDGNLLGTGLFEVCDNIAGHGYGYASGKRFDLWWLPPEDSTVDPEEPRDRTVERYARSGRFVVRDDTPPFQPDGWKSTDFTDQKARSRGRGFGLDIIFSVMRQAEYYPGTTSGNITVLAFGPGREQQARRWDRGVEGGMGEPTRPPGEVPSRAPGSGSGESELGGRPAHALRSLLELSRDLSVSLDLFEATDLLLFNLMGQVGTARAALWLTSEQDGVLTIVRCHGFNRRLAEGAMSACQERLPHGITPSPHPGQAWIVASELQHGDFQLLHQAGIALLAPLRFHGELIGWIALGARVDGDEYGGGDLEVLETALGMIAMSLENTRLFNRVREANRCLRATNDHLQELDRLKSEFLSNTNHELRTPLAVVLGAIECALDGPPLDPAIRRLLETGRECARNLGGIIESLLMWSDCLENRVVITLETGDARAVLEGVYRARLPGITEDLRELRLEDVPPLPLARFDPIRLEQILNELLDNAVKFTTRGACLRLRGSVDRDATGAWVRIDVEDDGPGIPAPRLSSLFKSFEQVDGSLTRRVGGLGLGLAFAYSLTERMGGSLKVASRVGAGTTFTLRLPLAEAEAAEAA